MRTSSSSPSSLVIKLHAAQTLALEIEEEREEDDDALRSFSNQSTSPSHSAHNFVQYVLNETSSSSDDERCEPAAPPLPPPPPLDAPAKSDDDDYVAPAATSVVKARKYGL